MWKCRDHGPLMMQSGCISLYLQGDALRVISDSEKVKIKREKEAFGERGEVNKYIAAPRHGSSGWDWKMKMEQEFKFKEEAFNEFPAAVEGKSEMVQVKRENDPIRVIEGEEIGAEGKTGGAIADAGDGGGGWVKSDKEEVEATRGSREVQMNREAGATSDVVVDGENGEVELVGTAEGIDLGDTGEERQEETTGSEGPEVETGLEGENPLHTSNRYVQHEVTD